MSKFEPRQSRHAVRSHKRKQNKLLNLLIAIVSILIIVVGYSVLSGGSEKANTSEQTSSKADNGSESASKKDASDQQQGDIANSDKQNNGSAGNTSAPSDSSAPSDGEQTTKDETKSDLSGGGPQGPWEPIGTTQKGSHVSSYERGSVDWNEKVKALLYATGIDDNNYILWRLENGGGPQESVGTIGPKDNRDLRYVVKLQWVDQKGWKPTSVDKVN